MRGVSGEALLFIVGPTAVGKTDIALDIAEEIGAEIVSADSMQVYRGMDIGTAKPTPAERARVAHHMLDVADPRENFSAGEYLRLAEAAIADIKRRGRLPLVVGGTGLYVRALTDGLFEGPSADWPLREGLMAREKEEPGALHRALREADPASAAKIHPSDIRRTVRALEVYKKQGRPISSLHRQWREEGGRPVRIAGLTAARPELYRRIEQRVETMMARGFLEEAAGLKTLGCTRDMPSMQALGYKQLMAHLDGELPLEEAVRLIKRDTKRYAKRQFTWFNADGRVRWVGVEREKGAGASAEAVKKALEIF